jgi:ADP-glucose pyrophosphorylase
MTDHHSKPAISFGGSYRLVDFVLSNLVNSGIDSIYLLTQYKPESLIWHMQDKKNMPIGVTWEHWKPMLLHIKT